MNARLRVDWGVTDRPDPRQFDRFRFLSPEDAEDVAWFFDTDGQLDTPAIDPARQLLDGTRDHERVIVEIDASLARYRRIRSILTRILEVHGEEKLPWGSYGEFCLWILADAYGRAPHTIMRSIRLDKKDDGNVLAIDPGERAAQRLATGGTISLDLGTVAPAPGWRNLPRALVLNPSLEVAKEIEAASDVYRTARAELGYTGEPAAVLPKPRRARTRQIVVSLREAAVIFSQSEDTLSARIDSGQLRELPRARGGKRWIVLRANDVPGSDLDTLQRTLEMARTKQLRADRSSGSEKPPKGRSDSLLPDRSTNGSEPGSEM